MSHHYPSLPANASEEAIRAHMGRAYQDALAAVNRIKDLAGFSCSPAIRTAAAAVMSTINDKANESYRGICGDIRTTVTPTWATFNKSCPVCHTTLQDGLCPDCCTNE